jgi:hypothetical protein
VIVVAVRLRCALAAMVVAVSAPAALTAQEPTVKTLPKPVKSCGGPLAIIMITAVDAKGAPITDGKISVKRERDGKAVPGTMADLSPEGEYVVMDDMALPLVTAGGTRFIVRLRRGKQTASTVVRIGRTSDGCHVRQIGAAQKLVVVK